MGSESAYGSAFAEAQGEVKTDIDGKALPGSLKVGDTTIVLPRPNTSSTFAVNGGGFTSESIILEPLAPRPPPRPKFSYSLSGPRDGWVANRFDISPSAQCYCGSSGIGFYTGATGPNVNVATVSGKAGVPLSFRWDGASICHGKSIQGFPSNIGTIDFGQQTTSAIPDIAGIADVTYPDEGTYQVKVNEAVTGTDIPNCHQSCSAQGSFTINISR